LQDHPKRGSGLTIHSSGLNCHWWKVVIALKVMVFLAFCIPAFVVAKPAYLAVAL